MRLIIVTSLLAATAVAGPATPLAGPTCDVGDRIVVVVAQPHGPSVAGATAATTLLVGSVTVIVRRSGRRTTAPVDAGSVVADDCGGTGGAHLGCGDTSGWVIHSRALGSDELLLPRFVASVLGRGQAYRMCRDVDEPRIATCATRSWFAAVGQRHDGLVVDLYSGPGSAGPLRESPMLAEAVPGKRVSVSVTHRGGFIELDGHREPCLAVSGATP
ncbi:MAG TPA: hypothetical protein VGG74_33480 [Kofleriaceae bacterium]